MTDRPAIMCACIYTTMASGWTDKLNCKHWGRRAYSRTKGYQQEKPTLNEMHKTLKHGQTCMLVLHNQSACALQLSAPAPGMEVRVRSHAIAKITV